MAAGCPAHSMVGPPPMLPSSSLPRCLPDREEKAGGCWTQAVDAVTACWAELECVRRDPTQTAAPLPCQCFAATLSNRLQDLHWEKIQPSSSIFLCPGAISPHAVSAVSMDRTTSIHSSVVLFQCSQHHDGTWWQIVVAKASGKPSAMHSTWEPFQAQILELSGLVGRPLVPLGAKLVLLLHSQSPC